MDFFIVIYRLCSTIFITLGVLPIARFTVFLPVDDYDMKGIIAK
jgi:hypothetical protein